MSDAPDILVATMQKRLGVPPTGHWDAVSRGALLSYQGTKGTWPMSPSGHPDPPTLANLGQIDPVGSLDSAWHAYVTGTGSKPSSFGRDLAASSNQIPRWAWLTVGALFVGVGFWTWHRSKGRTT